MSDTIEQILATHELVEDRRANGQPVWDRTINIKGIIGRDQSNDSDEHAIAVGKEIAALIRSRVPGEWLDRGEEGYDAKLTKTVEALEGAVSSGGVDDLNNLLDQLYDWADFKRVWLG